MPKNLPDHCSNATKDKTERCQHVTKQPTTGRTQETTLGYRPVVPENLLGHGIERSEGLASHPSIYISIHLTVQFPACVPPISDRGDFWA